MLVHFCRPTKQRLFEVPNITRTINDKRVPSVTRICTDCAWHRLALLACSDFYKYDILNDKFIEVSRDCSKQGGPDAGFTQVC
jgi:hypothetical protein